MKEYLTDQQSKSADRYGDYDVVLVSFARGLEDEIDRLKALNAELLEALKELADLMDAVRIGEYEPDSFTTGPARAAIAKAEGE